MASWTAFLSGLTRRESTTYGVASPWRDQSILERVTITDVFPGANADDFTPTRAAVLRIPAAARCHRLVMGAMSGLSIVAMRGATPVPLAEAPRAVTQPEDGYPPIITWSRVVDSLWFYGVAYLVIAERYEIDNRPRRFVYVDPTLVRWDEANGGAYVVDDRRIPTSDVVRIDSLTDGVLSTGLDAFRDAQRIRLAAARAGDNPVPSVELHQTEGTPLPESERRALIEGWAAARSGKNGGVAYTSPTIEARMHGQAAQQLLIEGRNVAALEVARAMGLPAWAVDASVPGSSLTYSNVPARARELLDYTLSPYLDAITARLSMDDVLGPGTWCRWDTSSLTRGDFTDRMTAYEIGIRAGVLSVTEARAIESGAQLEGSTPA